jgi:uncharacterized protein
MKLVILAAFVVGATPAWADVQDAVEHHALPAIDAFHTAATDLFEASIRDCLAEAMVGPYNAAFDAWLGMSHLQAGPVETGGRGLAIAFWPDKRGMVQRTVTQMVADQDPIVTNPDAFGDVSIAGRGLFALEYLLFDPELSVYQAGDYTCAMVRAISADMVAMADQIQAEWTQDYGPALVNAGAEGNTRFLTPIEAQRAIYTSILTGLEFTADQRIGRPLGTFDTPRPTRAEAWRSARSLRNVELSLLALYDLASEFADGPTPTMDDAFKRAMTAVQKFNDPVFARVAEPQGWFEADVMRQSIKLVEQAIAAEIGDPLGIAAGFNSSDGD